MAKGSPRKIAPLMVEVEIRWYQLFLDVLYERRRFGYGIGAAAFATFAIFALLKVQGLGLLLLFVLLAYALIVSLWMLDLSLRAAWRYRRCSVKGPTRYRFSSRKIEVFALESMFNRMLDYDLQIKETERAIFITHGDEERFLIPKGQLSVAEATRVSRLLRIRGGKSRWGE